MSLLLNKTNSPISNIIYSTDRCVEITIFQRSNVAIILYHYYTVYCGTPAWRPVIHLIKSVVFFLFLLQLLYRHHAMILYGCTIIICAESYIRHSLRILNALLIYVQCQIIFDILNAEHARRPR